MLVDTFWAFISYFWDFSLHYALPETSRWLVLLAFVAIPLGLVPWAWSLWVRYAHYAWTLTRKFTVLEIKLPQETIKSPAAMELVLEAFIQTGSEGTPHERYWQGKSRPWASLELAAIGGEVRFFIWCFDNQKNVITASIYAQYPDIAIHEVEDYTKAVYQNLDKFDVWGCQYEFVKHTAYPIKTYKDYGLSEDPDEEFKVDPLAPLIEMLSTTRPDNQVWFQFMIRAHKAESTIFNNKKKDLWLDGAKKEIQKVIDSASVLREDGTLVPSQGKMTTEKKDLIDALSRSIAKSSFDVGIRCLQIYPKGEKGHIKRDLIKGAFRQFGSTILNNIKPDDINYNYYYQDPFLYFKLPWGPREKWLVDHLFRCFIERAYFFYPYRNGAKIPWLFWEVKTYDKPNMVMNGEELATLYHFPGSTSKAPGLKRIPSKRADPPSNLPI